MQDETQDPGLSMATPDSRILVDWNKKRFEVVVTQYVDNGNTCICFLNPDSGALEAKATANLSKLPPYRVHIKDYSENRGIAAVLVSHRLLHQAGGSIKNGSEEFIEYQLLPKLARPFNINLPEQVDEPELDESLTQEIPRDNVPQVVEAEEPDSATTHAAMEAQQHAALVQKAKEDAAEKAAIAEDEKRASE